MPSPISSTNSSYYDPNAQCTPVDGGDGAASVSASNAPAAPPEVSIPPVVITGDAGAQQLVKQHDATRQQLDCFLEGATAALACGKAGLAAARSIFSSTNVIGTGLAIATALADGVACGKELRAYYDCKNQ